ncbi:hypothetical protein [Curtobacterium flaccumfaciens]|uniref:hypothetical protein n=1 Tax=Curtobacterium flaccumfaciens TaxID=2035 RepID=UPI0037BF0367
MSDPKVYWAAIVEPVPFASRRSPSPANKIDRTTGDPCNYDDITNSMRDGGWRGHPVDVAEMPDGAVTSMDNTRSRTARETGTPVQTRAHEHNEAMTADEVKRFRKSGTS